MARPLSDRTPGPLLLGGPAGAPPGGGALLGLRSLLQGNSKPKEPASCEFSSHCVRDSTVGGGGVRGTYQPSVPSLLVFILSLRSSNPSASRIKSDAWRA